MSENGSQNCSHNFTTMYHTRGIFIFLFLKYILIAAERFKPSKTSRFRLHKIVKLCTSTRVLIGYV